MHSKLNLEVLNTLNIEHLKFGLDTSRLLGHPQMYPLVVVNKHIKNFTTHSPWSGLFMFQDSKGGGGG